LAFPSPASRRYNHRDSARPNLKEDVMAKGKERPAKEKMKPKADKNKKAKHVPFGGKMPMAPGAMSTGKK
jgi:hypothetical protein